MFEFKDYNPKSFAIKRKMLGYSAAEIGRICRCTKQTVRNVETGKAASQSMIAMMGFVLDQLAFEKSMTKDFDEIDDLLKNPENIDNRLIDRLMSIIMQCE